MELSLFNYVNGDKCTVNNQRDTWAVLRIKADTGHMDIKLFPKHVLGGNFMINLAFKGLSWYGFGY